jgi:hypothetical protein
MESLGEATDELDSCRDTIVDLRRVVDLTRSFLRGIPEGGDEFVPARADECLSLSTFETSSCT